MSKRKTKGAVQDARQKLFQAWRDYVFTLEEAECDVLAGIEDALSAMGNNEMDC